MQARSRTRQTHRQRFQALAPDKQAQLLGPAEDEFIGNGFNKASLNKILAAAGMSKGQAYYYIKDKADLYCLVCERAFDRLTLAVEGWTLDTASPDTFWASVDRLFISVTLAFMGDERLAALGRSIYTSSEALAALAEPMAQMQGFMNETVRLGQSVGAVRTDMPADFLSSILFACVAAMDRWCALNLSTLPPDEAIQLNDLACGVFKSIASPLSSPHYTKKGTKRR